jgi:ABC-type Mn2+/Zn2+ transport system ATPase subunit
MGPVLVCRDLAVGYRGRAVLTGIDSFLRPGSSVALVGSNGSGKSTLLRTAVGLVPPVGGVIEVLGDRPGADPQGLAYLSQSHASGFVLPLRSIDVVRMARFDPRHRFRRLRADDHAAVREAMARMGVESLADAPVRSLSGGQQQRVYLAHVLARRASLVVLDEPTSGLDAPGRELYLNAIADERARGAAVMTATHDIGEATTCDRVMLLAGHVVAEGPPAVVLTPDNLLETFGIALASVDGRMVVSEHGHGHGPGHGHEPGPGHDAARPHPHPH